MELASYPPLAQQFFLKNINPCTRNLREPWGSRVKRLLEELCGTEEVIVSAIIDSKGNAVLYPDKEVIYPTALCMRWLKWNAAHAACDNSGIWITTLPRQQNSPVPKSHLFTSRKRNATYLES